MLSQPSSRNETPALPEQIAAIDLGSNSFHMVISTTAHGEIRTLDRLGEKVQLAAGLNDQDDITPEAQERALDCLKRFKQRAQDLDQSAIQIVGTNALRVAKNRKDFIRQAEALMGVPVEIISGREEARLIYLGVAHTLADDEGKRLVIDIGGGSTELIIGERFETKALESLHMGCVSYRDRYFPQGKLCAKAFDKAITSASQELLNIKQQYKSLGWQSSVGSSGSIKAVLNALDHLGLSHDAITLSALKQLKQQLIKLENSDKLAEFGVKSERHSIFAAGFSILYACFKVFGIKEMHYTNGALREGLLYDMIGRIKHEDVRERSINALQLRYGIDQEQAGHVETTVGHAYRQVASAWDIDDTEHAQLLTWASRTYEIGLAISHTQYHKHGAYLILHSDLPGFSRLKQIHLSALVRSHRRKLADEVFSSMDNQERETMMKLCLLFRLACVLTAARISAETGFQLKCKGKDLFLTLGQDWLDSHPLTYANLKQEQDYLRKQGFRLNLS